MSTPAPEKWRSFTRRELTFLDHEALDVVMAAQGIGAECRVSSNNSVIMRSPKTGETMSVSRNLSSMNRAKQNAHAQFRRVFGLTVDQAKRKIADEDRAARKAAIEQDREKAEVKAEALAQAVAETPFGYAAEYACTAKGCEARFGNESARNTHIREQHMPCRRWPECMQAFDTPQGEAAHYRLAHLGDRPRQGTGNGKRLRKTRPKPQPEVSEKVEIEQEPEVKQPDQTVRVVPPEEHVEPGLDHLEEVMGREDYVVLKKPTTFDELVAAIAKLLPDTGPTARERELEAELARVKEEFEDLQTKVELLKETLGL